MKCQGHQLRVFYIFAPSRDAVVLIGGDKTGNDRFHEEMIPRSEAIWAEFKEEQGIR